MEKSLKPLKKLPEEAKAGAVYTASVLITKGLSFITVPIFTRLLSTEEIGTVNLYNSWFSMISAVITLALTSGGYQLALKKYNDQRDEYCSSVLSITSLMALTTAALYFLLAKQIDKIVGLPHSLTMLMLVGLLVTPARDFWLARQRFEYKYKLAGFLSVFSAILAATVSVTVVLYQNSHGQATAEGRLFASNIVMYGVSFILWLYIICKGKRFYNKEYWTFSLALSIPLMGNSLAHQVLDVSDRLMINYYVGKSAVGIYGILYTVSGVSLIVWGALNSAYVPYLFKNIDGAENKKNIQKSSSLLLLAYAGVAVLATYLAPEIIRILATDEYYEAIYIMPPIAMGVSFNAVICMYSNVLIYYKKTKVIMYAACTAALSNVILNMIFIPAFGYQAAAYTTLVSYIILAVIEGVACTKTYKKETGESEMVYDNKSIIVVHTMMIIITFIGLFLYSFALIRYFVLVMMGIGMMYLFIRMYQSKATQSKEQNDLKM